MSAYITVPLCFFILLGVWLSFFNKALIYKIYTAIILFFVVIIVSADIELYKHWGFRIDATPLKYLASPTEAWASVSHLPVFWMLFFLLIIYILLLLAFNEMLRRNTKFQIQRTQQQWITILVLLVFTLLLIIPMRGGLQLAPLNQSSVYFSNNNFANHSAINASWSFLHGVMNKTSSSKNPYDYLLPVEAQKIKDSLYNQSGISVQLLDTVNPNIILIIWESFTDKATQLSVGSKVVTPYFNALKKEGIYFSNFYASGDRTDKGLAALLSGYPALPRTSILRTPNKASKLALLPRLFKERGYDLPFYYGGEPEFANIKSYLLSAGFDPIIQKNNFTAKDQNSKWGAHDGVVANKLAYDLSKSVKPFFATWLTLSSHEPFEIPTPPVFRGDGNTIRFLNSLNYTDEVLHAFIANCKLQPWWQNSLVIITADHGHNLPETDNRIDNFKIPMLWLGGALRDTGIVIDKISSQVDLAVTLAKQTGFMVDGFPLSKNIMDTAVKEWSFFSFNDGFGFIQPGKAYLFDNVGRRFLSKTPGVLKNDLKAGQAVQQHIYADFLNK